MEDVPEYETPSRPTIFNTTCSTISKVETREANEKPRPIEAGSSYMNASRSATWDQTVEKIKLREDLKWLENNCNKKIKHGKMVKWIIRGPQKVTVADETNFIDTQTLADVLKAKCIFEELSTIDLSKARSRANVFETIRNVFFMNRAALKMANIDAATEFMFTSLDYDSIHKTQDGPYYFADVCAGPGGFSEYILWRKKWCYKGFGFTLRGDHDFKLQESTCISPNSFHAYYGSSDDGNVCNPDNINDFKEVVLQQTKNVGVHFMMSDGGFSVEGNENLQEVLSKQLYVCQCLMALEIVRPHGYFVTKMFDLFTSFSVGLIYLMYLCFDKIAILKPNSSRPANSERYFICKGLRNTIITTEVRKYLRDIVKELWLQNQSENQLVSDILEIVPVDILKQETNFFKYIFDSNTAIAEKQKIGLTKLGIFCRNPTLLDPRQDMFRSKCLALWQIPDKKREPRENSSIDDVVNAISKPIFMLVPPKEIHNILDCKSVISDINEWHVAPLISSKNINSCNIFVGSMKSKAFKLVENKWVKVKNIKLNKGTLLYGETVKEKCTLKREGVEIMKYSLHVIDALRLGDVSLADLPFEERRNCIKTFCEAINFESTQNSIRIRQKISKPLYSLYSDNIVEYNKSSREYVAHLDVLGSTNSDEYQPVHSLLLLKTDNQQSFDSTYVLRAQIYISEDAMCDTSLSSFIELTQLTDFLKSANKRVL